MTGRLKILARARLMGFYVALALSVSALTGCGNAGSAASRGLAAQGDPLVHLPADQASHPKASNEWWYVVGHLRSGGRTFGYQATLFKFARVRPPGLAISITLYRTDIAITDETNHHFVHQITYYFPQSAVLSRRSLNVRIGNTSLAGPAPTEMRISGRFGRQSIQLRLKSLRPAMNVGGRGYLKFGDGYTYYYSLTDLATQGSLRIPGKTYQVSGISWLDHQWGEWSWHTIRGWTWMAWHLSDGTQLSVFDFRTTRQRIQAASLLTPNGQTRTIRRLSITALHHWVSPHTHATYPSGWLVKIPSLRLSIQVAPTVLDQEMTVPGQLRTSYWEGSTTLTGTRMGRPVKGQGYTELTGYAARNLAAYP